MNNYKSSASLKSLAKGQLLGNYGKVIPALLLHALAVFALQSMVMSLFASDSLLSTIAYYVIMFVVELVAGIFTAAECFIYLKLSCRYKITLSDIFYGFHSMPDKIIKAQFILSLIYNILLLPSIILSRVFQSSGNMMYYMLFCFAALIGNIIYVVINLHFSQIYYLMLDFPQYSVKKLYSLSNEIMKGHKGRLFYIQISFFPLFLLGILSLGIGFLWIIPYMYATETNFYLDIMSQRNKNMQQGNTPA